MIRFSAASRVASRLGRPLAACLALSLLAACGQTSQRVVTQPAASAAQWARPSSYDPPGPSHDPWGPYITQASQRFDIPERWIREVMRQESGGRVSATSRVGAMGLMQVMPGTYRELQGRYGLGSDPYHPWDSLMAGTAYLREMYELYGAPAFLAAYNAGPRRLEDYLWGGRGLPAETRNYVARIGPRIQGASPNRRAAPEVYAAAEIPLNIPAGPRRGDTATMLALRDQRQAVDPGIRVASLPPGPVVRMDPIPDGSTQPYSAPTQIASAGGVVVSQAAAAAPSGSVIAMAPIASLGDFQTRMEPIVSPGDFNQPPAAIPSGPIQMAQLAPLPGTVSRMEPIRSPGDFVAAAPRPALAPPPPAAPARRSNAPALAALGRSTPASPPAQPFVRVDPPSFAAAPAAPRGFSLIPQAHASTLPRAPAAAAPAGNGAWGIQVGAFASANLARAAAGQARDRVATLGARPLVQPVEQGSSRLYRARVLGLASRDAAEEACEKLRGRGACMVVAPGA